jgi:hypothetical protein
VSVLEAAAGFLGWTYRGADQTPRVAESGPWIPSGLVRAPGGPQVTDCCTFVAGVVLRAFPAARWASASWGRLVVGDPNRPWSVIDAVVEAGIGIEVQAPTAGRWHVAQGWSGLSSVGVVVPGKSTGHTWLQLGTDRVLQASSSAGKVCWTDRTWDVQRARYERVRLVLLEEA